MIDQHQLENLKYFNHFGSMMTNDAKCTREIKSRIAMAKEAFNRIRTIFTSISDLNVRKKLVNCYISSIALNTAETRTFRKVNQKYLGSYEIWCRRRKEKISWTDRVRSGEVLRRVREDKNIIHTIKRSKANWIGHILRRNCLLKHTVEGKIGEIEMMGKQGRRRKQLLDYLKERKGYWKLQEEAPDRIV